jgi:LmbE family N-acetylglucosaminyl deacetylase
MQVKDIKNVLVFAAHHDDEVIGCGGTIKKLTSSGVNVHVVFATDGATGVDHTRDYENNIESERIKESKLVAKMLGIKNTYDWSMSCQNLQYTSALMQKAVGLIRKIRPEIIITHSKFEKHSDHQVLSQIVTQAAWKSSEDILPDLGEPYRVPNVWAYEVVDTLPEVHFSVDITEYFNTKLEAMQVYSSQQNVVSGICRMMKGLTMTRGYDITSKHAEAFMNISIQPKEVLT